MAKFLFVDLRPRMPRINPIIAGIPKRKITLIKKIGTAGYIRRSNSKNTANIIVKGPLKIPQIKEMMAFVFEFNLDCKVLGFLILIFFIIFQP